MVHWCFERASVSIFSMSTPCGCPMHGSGISPHVRVSSAADIRVDALDPVRICDDYREAAAEVAGRQ